MDETKFITITISDKIYQGFSYKIPLDYALSVDNETLANETRMYMKNFFDSHGLIYLKEGVDKLTFHIHEPIQKTDNIIYICTYCSELYVDNKKMK